MVRNLSRHRSVSLALPFVDPTTRTQLRHLRQMYGAGILFFLGGYAITALAFQRGWQILGEGFVGVVFLSGAVFVGLGLTIQSLFVEALLKTMGRLVPICAYCHRVRIPGSQAHEPDIWQVVDLRFSSDEVMTYTICPACAAQADVPAEAP